MKTLYININNEQIQSNEELEVLNYDLDSDFFFYLGEKIAKGCNVENENALIADFNTQDNNEDYKKIIAQWNEIKTILFSEECEGKFEFALPNGYIHWLRYNEKYNTVYDRNFSHGESNTITIDLEELYEESVEEMQRKIVRKLKRDNLNHEIDEIVFNDDAITRKSLIFCVIKKEFYNIGFIANKKFNKINRAIIAESNITQKCYEDDFFPLEGIFLGKTMVKDVDLRQVKLIKNNIIYKPKDGITFICNKDCNKFTAVFVRFDMLPPIWDKLLCSPLDKTIGEWNRLMLQKGFKSVNNNLFLYLSPNNIFGFHHFAPNNDKNSKISGIVLYLTTCPYCNSSELGFIDVDGKEMHIPLCKNCGNTYWNPDPEL